MTSDWVSFRVEDRVFYITKTTLNDVAPGSLLYKLATSNMVVDKDPSGAILLEVPLDMFLIVYRVILDGGSEDYIRFMRRVSEYAVEEKKRIRNCMQYLGVTTKNDPYRISVCDT